MFFAFAGVLSKHRIFLTASKERGRSGSLLSRSEPLVPVVYLVGHLIGIPAILLCYFLLLSLLYCGWARDVQKHANFWFTQYYTDYDIYIFWSSAPWRVSRHGSVLRLELSHGTIRAVPLSKNLLKLFGVLPYFSATKHRATSWRSLLFLEWIIINNDYIFFLISCFLLDSAK